jgi:hypothetical protein
MTKNYTCIICHKKFNDAWEHALTLVGKGFFWGYNKVHSKYGHAIEHSNFEKPCFCGGHITINGTGADSWETTCDNCGFLFDED